MVGATKAGEDLAGQIIVMKEVEEMRYKEEK